MREAVKNSIQGNKVIAIARHISLQDCVSAARALYAGGIRLMEITFDQSRPESWHETADAISLVKEQLEGTLHVGAGTVLTPEQVQLAAAAGAEFLISPDVNVNVIEKTRDLGLVSIPGAMTPTEIVTAYHLGADYVKLFPISTLGSAYVKALQAPLASIPLLAVGGVNETNIAEFLSAGIVGVGVGGNLVNREWIAAGAFEKLTETARTLMAAVRTIE